ncbi:hypothetical protein [uncultured Dysosmobacter sp.]|uniref:hypothetical protein n=1 Tax=uncultured Dysosmobacter sp. TaxID=2591384 RepID=UPI00260C3457|nr:hypothetical protein [uncultured Dysosmobacter sp.]
MGKMKELATVLDRIANSGDALTRSAEKLRDLVTVIDDLAGCGKALKDLALSLKEYFTASPETAQDGAPLVKEEKSKPRTSKAKQAEPGPLPEPEPKTAKAYTKEEVRKILAGISQSGYKEQVIGILAKYGSGNITGLKPEDYAAVVAEAEELTNG